MVQIRHANGHTLQVDIGTAWHMLPHADADPEMLDENWKRASTLNTGKMIVQMSTACTLLSGIKIKNRPSTHAKELTESSRVDKVDFAPHIADGLEYVAAKKFLLLPACSFF